MYKLVLLRHGQSEWNSKNLFTGWADPGLTERGVHEANQAADKLKQDGYVFDEVYTNVLKRCIKTTWIVLEKMDLMWIPIHKSWKLNERFYGALTGLNKSETAQKYGEEQVQIWRRSYDVRPPELEKDDERYPGNDPKFADLSEEELPTTECLKDVVERMVPYFEETIVPRVKAGKRIMVSASGNSLRAIVKHLEGVSDDEILKVEIPTGVPLVYELNENFEVVGKEFLMSQEELEAAINEVKSQGKV